MSDEPLPPLPEPCWNWKNPANPAIVAGLFNHEQMQAYACEAVRAALAANPAPTSGNDEVEAMCEALEAIRMDLTDSAASLIHKQADELAWRRQEMTKLIEIVASSATQIAELQKATAQTSVSPTPADSAARPETE